MASVASVDAPNRLTLVKGAGGLLVELGEDGVTLRDLASDLPRRFVVVMAGPGHPEPHRADAGSAAAQDIPCAGLVIGAWPREPGVAEAGNREALNGWLPVRAVLPDGAGAEPRRVRGMSADAFDPQWVASLV